MSSNNDWVLPAIAGGCLLCLMQPWLILVFVGLGIYALCKSINQREERKEELNSNKNDNRYTATEDQNYDSYDKWKNGIVADPESSNEQRITYVNDFYQIIKSHRDRMDYMKICPKCDKIYPDGTNKYCGDCGTYLISKREYDRKNTH